MPFKPKYTITDKILNNIAAITAAREIVEHSRLIPKWEMRLRKEARIHSAHSSTRIEGNRLTLQEVQALSENKGIIAAQKDKQEVLNYLQALDAVPRFAKKTKITLETLLDIHRILTQKTLRDERSSGAFRDRQVYVGKRLLVGTQMKEVVEYLPPATKDVPGLVNAFLDWLNSDQAQKINPVVLAGIAHYEIARIHPFIDGNGRTARLLASLALFKSGFDHRRFFALDDYYDEDRDSYYAALKTVQQDEGDVTRWLEYFIEGVLISVNKVKTSIANLGFFERTKKSEQIELTQKQITIIGRMREKGKLSNKDLREMLNISRQAVIKEIAKLMDAKIVRLIGKGRGAYYELEENL